MGDEPPITLAYAVPFTQYLRPNGRRVQATIQVAGEVAEAARAVVARGWRFEVEVLTTREVSLTVVDFEDMTLAIDIVPNGPGVIDAVGRIAMAAAKLAVEADAEVAKCET